MHSTNQWETMRNCFLFFSLARIWIRTHLGAKWANPPRQTRSAASLMVTFQNQILVEDRCSILVCCGVSTVLSTRGNDWSFYLCLTRSGQNYERAPKAGFTTTALLARRSKIKIPGPVDTRLFIVRAFHVNGVIISRPGKKNLRSLLWAWGIFFLAVFI